MADMVVYRSGRKQYLLRRPFIYVSVYLSFGREDSNVNRQTTNDGYQVMTKAHTVEKTKCTI
jgi:hypothetical protein